MTESRDNWFGAGLSTLSRIINGNSVNRLKADIFYFFLWNFQISDKDISYQLFGIFIIFFLHIEDSYIFTSCIGF